MRRLIRWDAQTMAPGSAVARPAIMRSRGAAIALLGAALLSLAWIEISLDLGEHTTPLWTSALVPVTALAYATAGAAAWWRRPSNQLAPIMLAGALLLLLGGLAGTDVLALSALGVVLATAPLAVVVHLLHAFPSGRLRSATSRCTVGTAYAVCLLLQVPLYLFAPAASPHGVLALADRPTLASAGSWLQTGAGAAVMVATAVILVGRLRATPAPRRRVLAPLYGYGIAAVLLVPLVPDVVRPVVGLSPALSGAMQLMVLAAVPVAFACAMLLGGFARTGEIQELSAWLGTSGGSRPPLTAALAQALGDDSVQLAFWVPDRDTYVDAEGHPMALPAQDTRRAVAEVEVAGRRVGAIVYDATMIDDPGVVHTAGQVIAIALDQQRLAAELRASERKLLLSRARIVAAGDRERHRIAQDLHDGVQAQLVLLAVEAQRLAGMPGTSPPSAAAATRLRVRIDETAARLRQLVYGVMPAPLIERGLGAALEDLLDRMPVATSLDLGLDGPPLSAPVQSTTYFLVAEAMSNTVKYADATKVGVRLTHLGQALIIEVDDDGVGGAQLGTGLGLPGLADRVDALGGRLRIESPPGGGTHIVAELPCGSRSARTRPCCAWGFRSCSRTAASMSSAPRAAVANSSRAPVSWVPTW
jgi:signal transduction histidine kinase